MTSKYEKIVKSGIMGEIIADVLQSVPHLLNMPSNHIRIDYDQDGDVLYVSFLKTSTC